MGMEYGPFGLANLALDIWNGFAAAWSGAGGGERLLWILLFATVPSAGYAAWLVTGQRDGWAFG